MQSCRWLPAIQRKLSPQLPWQKWLLCLFTCLELLLVQKCLGSPIQTPCIHIKGWPRCLYQSEDNTGFLSFNVLHRGRNLSTVKVRRKHPHGLHVWQICRLLFKLQNSQHILLSCILDGSYATWWCTKFSVEWQDMNMNLKGLGNGHVILQGIILPMACKDWGKPQHTQKKSPENREYLQDNQCPGWHLSQTPKYKSEASSFQPTSSVI